MNTDEKLEALKKLKKEMEADRRLPLRTRDTRLVFGEGDPDAKIYMLGEGPGFHENLLGRPFVGQAGKLLDKLIESIAYERKKVYISNVVRFRPPENRDPLPEEIAAFQPYVDREIEIINPKIIVTLGRFSMGKFFPGEKISNMHGKAREIVWNVMRITVVPMYHPAAALRAGNIMRAIKEDFQVIPKVLKEILEAEEEERKRVEQTSLF
ncbi:MAG: uracil-DNA glycosylase [bacterium]|nr:uracil-DNA glycosylase [bacterium]